VEQGYRATYGNVRFLGSGTFAQPYQRFLTTGTEPRYARTRGAFRDRNAWVGHRCRSSSSRKRCIDTIFRALSVVISSEQRTRGQT
jgi:hypothetical protein